MLAVVGLVGTLMPLQFLGNRSLALAPQYNPLDVLTDTSSKYEIIRAINHVSLKYGVNANDMIRVAQCESGIRHDVFGDNGKAYGIYQFLGNNF
jgi:hypothetical protein